MAADERTRLLAADQGHATEPEAETAEDIQRAAEAIRATLPRRRVILSLVSVYACMFMVALDGTLVAALIGSISSTFTATDRIFWLSSAYLLTMCAFAPIWGRTADVVGRKACLLCSVFIFGLGTVLCTLATSMNGLIVARGIQGVGAAGVQPAVSIVINDMIPMRSRGIYQAITQAVFSLGYAMGGPTGGFLNDKFGWRFAFTVQLPPLVLSLFLLSTIFHLPELPKTAAERQRRAELEGKPLLSVLWARLDPLGTVLLITSVVVMLLSLSAMSGYDLRFADWRVWGGLTLSVVLLAAFLFVEMRVAREPLVSLRLMRNTDLTSIWAIYFVMSVGGALLFYFPFYFFVVLDQTATEVGFHYLPVSVSTLLGSIFTGLFLKRSGKYRTPLFLLTALYVITPTYLATWTDTNRPSPFGQNVSLVPAAFGGAAMNTALMVALMALAGQQDVASALSLLYFFRSLGAIIGTSTMGALIQKVLVVELNKRIHGKGASKTIDIIRKDIGAIAYLPAKERRAAVESYSKALQTFEIVMTASSFLIFVFLFLIKNKDINEPTSSVPATQQRSQDRRDEEQQ